MEVHHHSSPAQGGTHTARKKWTHYFWEFLMLFLAVFCGFLAEYKLEHMIEHQREKKLVNSLVNDLKADTTRLISIINSRYIRDVQIDSMFLLINSDDILNHTKDIYFIAVTIPRNIIIQFLPNDGTIQQLKNAGGLRLIRKQWIADSIVKYDVASRSLEKFGDQEKDIVNIYRETAPEILNALQINKMTDESNTPVRISFNPPLETDYKQFLNKFNYKLVSIKNINKGYRREAKKLLLQATNLITTLKTEYHLK